jgi:hypothetical protein
VAAYLGSDRRIWLELPPADDIAGLALTDGTNTWPLEGWATAARVELAERPLVWLADAAGAVFDFSGNAPYAIVVAPSGKKVSGDPSFVMGFRPQDARFNPLRLETGRWAVADHEVVLDAGTAKRAEVEVGGIVRIAALTPAAPFRVVGIARFGEVSPLGGATMAVFDRPVAQHLLKKAGRIDVVREVLAVVPGRHRHGGRPA